MNLKRLGIGISAGLLSGCLLGSSLAWAYPLDGYERTGIRRLELYRLANLDEIRWRKQPEGGLLPTSQVYPRWRGSTSDLVLKRDADLSAKLSQILRQERQGSYGVALIDLSDPANPRYASHNGNLQANVGSVGKTLVALGVFHVLANIYPDDIAARERVLRDSVVLADKFIEWDHHEVPIFFPDTRKREYRRLKHGDRGTLWEYLDWMMSASSNAAAAMVQKHLLALDHFGQRYPVPEEELNAWYAETSHKELGEIQARIMDGAVLRAGLDPARIRQGSFFTSYGKRQVGGRPSFSDPEQLAKLLFRIESGTSIDEWSSTEFKRLLYMTQKRIRYASHPALHPSAVYFKSGSYYKCSVRGACAKYEGDVINRLASIATIESPAPTSDKPPELYYMVAVMSNVLKINSAVAHQTLALRIHRMLEREHGLR